MKNLLTILISVLFFLQVAKGQGEIYGKVRDTNDMECEGVEITVSQGILFKVAGLSEKDGSYSINPLAPGTYDLEFSVRGYCKTKITGVSVSLNGTIAVNCKIRSGNSEDTIFPMAIPRVYPHIKKEFLDIITGVERKSINSGLTIGGEKGGKKIITDSVRYFQFAERPKNLDKTLPKPGCKIYSDSNLHFKSLPESFRKILL